MKDNQDLQCLGNPLREVKKMFDEMIIPYRPHLWKYCCHLTGSPWDAEDLVQETLIKAFSSLSQLWQPINPKGYLFKIASNTWVDQCRRMKLKMDSIETTNEQFFYEEVDSLEVYDAIENLVLYLPPRQRVVFLLMEVFQFKAKEVAEIIGTTEGAIKSLLNRARGKVIEIKENTNKEELKPISSKEYQEVINQFMVFFNQRDPDGIASLLDVNMSNDIVHIAQEIGKDVVRKYSLTDWAKDPVDMRAELHYLWGRPIIVQVAELHDSKAVYDVNYLEIENGKIVEMKDYYFCPELLNEVANVLNIKAFPRNYTLG